MNVLQNLNLGWSKRVPLVLQTEASECGLASMTMIAQYFGYGAGLSELRRRFAISLKGATLKDLIRVADQIGFAARPLRVDLSELGQLRLPCVLHWDLNHFVVLASVGQDSAVIHDPAMGIRRLSMAVISRHFTGVALELTPTNPYQPATPAPRVRASQPIGRIKGIKRSLAHMLALALAIEIFAMVSPFFMSWVVDHALVSADRDLLVTLAIGFFLLMLLRTAVSTLRRWLLMGMSASLKVESRANLFSHLVNLPASYFEARHLGDMMSRFGSQETIPQAITTELVEAMLDGLCHHFRDHDALCAGSRPGGGVRYAALRPAALGFLHAFAPCLVGGDRLGRPARQPFPRNPARHPHDQTVQRAGRPAGAMAQSAGRDHHPIAHGR
jgi:ATP-binding cassette, subfamily B, bacterial CvaB/MchF/RaxB